MLKNNQAVYVSPHGTAYVSNNYNIKVPGFDYNYTMSVIFDRELLSFQLFEYKSTMSCTYDNRVNIFNLHPNSLNTNRAFTKAPGFNYRFWYLDGRVTGGSA